MYIILKEENHPDRILESCFGPYETYEEATAVAEKLYYSPSNYNAPYQHRLYTFIVRELSTPY